MMLERYSNTNKSNIYSKVLSIINTQVHEKICFLFAWSSGPAHSVYL